MVSSVRRGSRARTRCHRPLRHGRRSGRDLRSDRPTRRRRCPHIPLPLPEENLVDVPTWVWIATAVVTIAIFTFDLAVVGRRPHEPSMQECATYLSIYVGLAVIFGLGVWYTSGGTYALEFYSGWLVEYSLSIDNLFIFIIIMAKFAVPRELQQYALMIGIVMALIMRAIFIAVGAAAISNFSWVFYIFGLFLVYTAFKLAKEGAEDEDDEFEENKLVAFIERRFPATSEWHGKSAVHPGGRQADDHADVHRDHHAGHDRPAVRARLDPGDLRHHQGALPGADGQHLRADGPAPALLPHRRPAAAPDLPVVRPGVPAGLHRREAVLPRDCTRTSSRSSTAASPSTTPGWRSRSGSRWWSSWPPWPSPRCSRCGPRAG